MVNFRALAIRTFRAVKALCFETALRKMGLKYFFYFLIDFFVVVVVVVVVVFFFDGADTNFFIF